MAEALDRTGFRGGQLTLEVTEDAIVDPDSALDLQTLSEMGVQLSVDDVGTNWSSFEPLKRHSISTLKIDGSFIAGLEQAEGINRLVVETVIHMAHSLGMSAIVESVETASQVDIVRSFRADAAQGFFFAKPMSSQDAAAFAAGPDVPQFSFTETMTLMKPHAGPEALAAAAATTEADEAATPVTPVSESVADVPDEVGPVPVDMVDDQLPEGAPVGGTTEIAGMSEGTDPLVEPSPAGTSESWDDQV